MGVHALFPHCSKHLRGHGNAFVLVGEAAIDLLASVFKQLFYRGLFVEEAIDKGAVGAVFQQSAHQVGKQVPMVADGGVDAHRDGFC